MWKHVCCLRFGGTTVSTGLFSSPVSEVLLMQGNFGTGEVCRILSRCNGSDYLKGAKEHGYPAVWRWWLWLFWKRCILLRHRPTWCRYFLEYMYSIKSQDWLYEVFVVFWPSVSFVWLFRLAGCLRSGWEKLVVTILVAFWKGGSLCNLLGRDIWSYTSLVSYPLFIIVVP